MSQVKLDPSIKRAITNFDEAAQMYAFSGSYNPEERASIEEIYVRKRANLETLIAIKIAAAAK